MTSIAIPKVDGHRLFTDDEYADAYYEMFDDIWKKVFDGIQSEAIPYAYYDTGREDSFTRYALHRSPKQRGFLQISVMWIHDNQMIPLSDSQADTWQSFRREVASANGITLMIGTWE